MVYAVESNFEYGYSAASGWEAGIAFHTRLGFVEALASGRWAAGRLEDERLTRLRLSIIMPSRRAPTVAGRAMAEHPRGALARFAAGFETGARAA